MASKSDIAARLSALRTLLKSEGLDGLIVPRADAHQSEVAAPHDDRLAFITGFTGSAGLALVLEDKALIFVDGRYEIQVRHEVSAALYEVHHLHNDPIDSWLAAHGSKGWRIGFDPMLIDTALYDRLAASAERAGFTLVPISKDPFDAIWTDRPEKPLGRIRPMSPTLAGETVAAKTARLGRKIADAGADMMAETLPDNIAWLLNLRGSDIAMNPVPQSFMVLNADGAVVWFVDSRKLPNDLTAFELEEVSVRPAEEFIPFVHSAAASRTVLIDQSFAPVALRLAVEGAGGTVLSADNPLTLAKARKTPAELAGYRACHVEDGIALTEFLAWLEREAPGRAANGNPIREIEAEDRLLAFRARRKGFLEASFRSISASGANAAMCHYNAGPQSDAAITPDGPYLIDSGGQYENGTTDVTRTLFLAAPEDRVRATYTAVLKGFIALITAQFPEGTCGHQLDALARLPLWQMGLDYDHGTGHGVGHNLLVHEYPHRFAKKANHYGLEPGNIMTIEPGYYEADGYGLRIENQVEVTAALPGFCRFRSLTLAPIDLKPVDIAALSPQEIAFINDYHATVRETLADHVSDDARDFLMRSTRALEA
ncbi:aminopeptidase P family protein [Martelella mediterranea]|uniref:aminopeptidase P family protein n=1 Tax=Martelella mediterranea TaxID=293089 RepID=UPI001E441FDD|nr:aminopeptidase P family protein [Martelella mediterranea]MCD1633736.1 aminopeptidase P family protein [Martelella mediterranea]